MRQVSKTPPSVADKRHVETHAEPACRAGDYLTFRISGQEFAMEASCVLGLLPASELRKFDAAWEGLRPAMASLFGPLPLQWVCGVASMRGIDFPVIDLPAKLGLPSGKQGRNPCIVAVKIQTKHGRKLAGFLADRVSDVVRARERDFLNGKLRVSGRARRVIDPESLLEVSP